MKIERAPNLRKTPTNAEKRLWTALRNRQIAEVKFRRQVTVGRYIVDFVAYEERLIIEVDGGQHADSTTDAKRTEYLEGEGIRVIRFWNNEVLENLEGVLQTIAVAIES